MRLSIAMLYVKDLPSMAAFYGGTLGLQAISETRTDTWVEFDAGGTTFALHAIPADIADQVEMLSTPIPREKNPVKLMFEVEDVGRERERLMALGVVVLQRTWGASDGVDPEGNIFQIFQRSGPESES